MKSDLSGSHEYKVEGRQSIHARKMSKFSASRNGEVGCDGGLGEDSRETLKYAPTGHCQGSMAQVDGQVVSVPPFDGRLCVNEVMKAISETPETKQLKDLLLVHLDWSQHQHEQLQAKERVIQALRKERDALKCRLDRMERRMSLLRQKGADFRGSPSPGGRDGHPGGMGGGRAPSASGSTSSPGGHGYGRGIKRKQSLEPQNLAKRFVTSRAERSARSSESAERERTPRSSTRRSLLASDKSESVCSMGGSNNKGVHNLTAYNHHHSPHYARSRSGDNTTEAETECTDDDSQNSATPKTRNFFRKQWKTDSLTASEALRRRPYHLRQIVFRRRHSASSNRADQLLRTDRMYFVGKSDDDVKNACLSPVRPEVKQLKVPSWRVHHVPTGYQLEGTENLDDEIFVKRHQKPEQEEKRRKRWDLQRIREQRLYEKLQSGRSSCTDLGVGMGAGGDVTGSVVGPSGSGDVTIFQTFLPDPDEVMYIEVNEEVPVSAFGYPIPRFSASEFSLPWFDLDKRERQEKKSTRGKRR